MSPAHRFVIGWNLACVALLIFLIMRTYLTYVDNQRTREAAALANEVAGKLARKGFRRDFLNKVVVPAMTAS